MNQNNIIPIFKTQGSIGRSLLTTESEDKDLEIIENSPVSIFAIAKQFNIDKLVVIDNSFLEFPKLYKTCNEKKIQLIFGLNFTMCNDISQKNDESLLSNCKVNVLMKNSEGYKDLIKLNDAINGNVDGFYYETRGDYSILKYHFTDNLQLLIPPHNNFLEKNLIYNGKCLPDFGKIKPIMTYCNIELPYTQVLNPAIKTYAKNNNFELQEVHPILYLKKQNFRVYSCLRAINKRTKFSAPNIDYLCSNEFSWESYMERIN